MNKIDEIKVEQPNEEHIFVKQNDDRIILTHGEALDLIIELKKIISKDL
jgi:hypothetical protein